MLYVQPDTINVKTAESVNAENTAEEPVLPKTEEEFRQTAATTIKTHKDSNQTAALQTNESIGIHPDSINRASQPAKDSLKNIDLPLFYRENFFSKSPLYHPEIRGIQAGMPGNPKPYAISNDNIITSLLLLCFVLTAVAYAQSHRFLTRQIKTFFHVQHGNTTEIIETSNELRFQVLFLLQTCLLFSILIFFYTRQQIADSYFFDATPSFIGVFFGVFVCYFLLKYLLSWFVNWVFFDSKQNRLWQKTTLFLHSIEGIMLYPLVMLMSYFRFSVDTAVIYTIVVIAIIKILLLYKSYIIFFRKIGSFFQIILYFCALEIMPPIALWGFFSTTVNYLQVHF